MSVEIADAVVVGAGVFGSWIALALRRAGYSVSLLERDRPGHARSSSGGESRIIRMYYGADELYTRMAKQSLEEWRRFLRDEGKADLFRQTGVLWLAHRDNPSLRASAAALSRAGVPHEFLNQEELGSRYPQLRFEANTAGIFEPESGALLAERSVRAVHNASLREGVEYFTGTVRPPEGAGGRLDNLVMEGGQTLAARVFLFTCGAWLPKLFPNFLAAIVQPTRQELFFFEHPSAGDAFLPEHLPVWIDETESRIAYGFPDLDGAGLKTAFHRLGAPFDPDEGDREIKSEEVEEAAAYLRRRFPVFEHSRLKSSRVCQYENTSSGDFLIDRHPEFDNVWIAGGGSGHGFKHGPAVADYVRQVVFESGEEEPRFSLRFKKRKLDRRVI